MVSDCRQVFQDVQTSQNTRARNQVRAERHAETLAVYAEMAASYDRHRGRHHDKRDQRTHADHIPQQGCIHQTSHQPHRQTNKNGVDDRLDLITHICAVVLPFTTIDQLYIVFIKKTNHT